MKNRIKRETVEFSRSEENDSRVLICAAICWLATGQVSQSLPPETVVVPSEDLHLGICTQPAVFRHSKRMNMQEADESRKRWGEVFFRIISPNYPSTALSNEVRLRANLCSCETGSRSA